MSEFNYPANSNLSKQEAKADVNPTTEEKRVTKVVKGNVKTKTNEARKFADVFISEDINNVKSYILMDVLVPAIKKAVADIVTNGVEMILYGSTSKGRNSSSSSKVSYRNYYDSRDDGRGYNGGGSRTRSGLDYDDFVFDSRGEAEAVLSQMGDIIEKFKYVTVADLYDMVDKVPPFTANKYGWTSIRNADVVRDRDGYRLKLPRAMQID